MYKIGAVGDRESVLAFRAFGMETAAADTPEEAREAVKRMENEEFSIIFLTEQLAEGLPDLISEYAEKPSPAVIMIPGSKGSLGIGMAAISAAVEKAVGADIFAEGTDN